MGFEPTAYGLRNRCSTAELSRLVPRACLYFKPASCFQLYGLLTGQLGANFMARLLNRIPPPGIGIGGLI